jgi:hypothetical protein
MISCTQRNFKRFLGIALGGGRGKNTAVAVLDRTTSACEVVFVGFRQPRSAKTFYDPQLTDFVLGQPPDTLVSISAPLFLPACLRCARARCPGPGACSDPAVSWFVENKVRLQKKRGRSTLKPSFTPYTQRVCEVLLRLEHAISFREALGQSLGPLTARAQFLLRRWSPRFERGINVIEVNPMATIQRKFGNACSASYRRSAQTWEVRAKILEELRGVLSFTIWREPILQKTRLFEAVICAYTGFLWCVEQWNVPTALQEIAHQDGWIWIPPADPQTP